MRTPTHARTRTHTHTHTDACTHTTHFPDKEQASSIFHQNKASFYTKASYNNDYNINLQVFLPSWYNTI